MESVKAVTKRMKINQTNRYGDKTEYISKGFS